MDDLAATPPRRPFRGGRLAIVPWIIAAVLIGLLVRETYVAAGAWAALALCCVVGAGLVAVQESPHRGARRRLEAVRLERAQRKLRERPAARSLDDLAKEAIGTTLPKIRKGRGSPRPSRRRRRLASRAFVVLSYCAWAALTMVLYERALGGRGGTAIQRATRDTAGILYAIVLPLLVLGAVVISKLEARLFGRS